MISFFPILLRKVLLEVFPQALFVIRVYGMVAKARASRIKFAFCFPSVAIFKEVRKLETLILVEFWKDNNVGIMWFLVDALPMNRVVYFWSSFEGLLKAEIVVTMFKCVKTDIFVLLSEQFELLRLLLLILRLETLMQGSILHFLFTYNS